jgi:hypothetical protein
MQARYSSGKTGSAPGILSSQYRIYLFQQSCPPQKAGTGVLQPQELGFVDARAGYPDDIPARFHQVPQQAYGLIQAPACSIALNCVPNAPAGHEATPAVRPVIPEQTQHHQWMRVTGPCLPHLPESLRITQTIPALQSLYREALAALGAPGLKNIATAGRAHAREEAVHAKTAANLGLISSFGRHLASS